VDEKLNVVPDDRITYVIMGSYCSKAVWLDTKKYILDRIKSVGFNFTLFKQLFSAWWQYEYLAYALWIYQFSTKWSEKLHLVNKSNNRKSIENHVGYIPISYAQKYHFFFFPQIFFILIHE
jgi:aarF domain-containing kinase